MKDSRSGSENADKVNERERGEIKEQQEGKHTKYTKEGLRETLPKITIIPAKDDVGE